MSVTHSAGQSGGDGGIEGVNEMDGHIGKTNTQIKMLKIEATSKGGSEAVPPSVL